ncbi:MAG: thioredoxin-like fold [Pedosphaera sp.]|nr:thioredoxin-like fold [Pedosphaera sp.]
MKKLIPIMALCWLAAQVSAAEWLTDLPKALAQAKAEHKQVLMEFTGSDWCPPCKALHKNVMTSPEFEAYAQKNLVLVELDFPHAKKQTEELKTANKALAEKYKIEGFPTVIVLDGDGKELSKDVGYSGEQPKVIIEKLEQLKKKESP